MKIVQLILLALEHIHCIRNDRVKKRLKTLAIPLYGGKEYMDIKIGDVVAVKHYTGLSPFKSVVVDVGERTMALRLSKQFASLNCFEGDPVVVGFETNSKIYVASCTIEKINLTNSIIQLSVEIVEFVTDKRTSERFPVSFYADIREKESRNVHNAVVKNISLNGLMVCCKSDLPEGMEVEVDVSADKTPIFLDACVIRKAKKENYYEYGFKIINKDNRAQNVLGWYMQVLKEEQEEFVKEIKY